MKKTIIALVALAGGAMGTEQSLTLPDSTTVSLATQVLGTSWNNILTTTSTYEYGLYYGVQKDGVLNSLNADEGSWVNANNIGSITLNGRDAYDGAAFIMVLGKDLTAGTVISSITFSATNAEGRPQLGKRAGGNVTLGLGIVDSTGNLLKTAGGASFNVGAANNSNTQKLELTDAVTWQEGYKVVAIIDGAFGDGNFNTTAYTLKDVTVTATTIPEPTTATLSLLALVGLAARRRRK